MVEKQISRCGIYCDDCKYREKMHCPGCQAAKGKMFWGKCAVASCTVDKGLTGCGGCKDIPCEALREFSYDTRQGDNGLRIRNLLEARDGIDPLIAICGASCTECPAYVATQANDHAALQRIAGEWTASLGKPFSAADVRCEGCRARGRYLSKYCASCEIRACADAKSNRTCAHCDTGLCDKISSPKARQALEDIRARLRAGTE